MDFHPTTCAISAYHHSSCEFEPHSGRGVLDTMLCDNVCQWLATGPWFSQSTLVSSTNKTDCHDITEILLKVALSTLNQPSLLKLNIEWLIVSWVFSKIKKKSVKKIFLDQGISYPTGDSVIFITLLTLGSILTAVCDLALILLPLFSNNLIKPVSLVYLDCKILYLKFAIFFWKFGKVTSEDGFTPGF